MDENGGKDPLAFCAAYKRGPLGNLLHLQHLRSPEQVAGGISWKPGDKIIVPVPDFPSNVYPWVNLERSGVEICFLNRKNEGRFDVSDIKPCFGLEQDLSL